MCVYSGVAASEGGVYASGHRPLYDGGLRRHRSVSLPAGSAMDLGLHTRVRTHWLNDTHGSAYK